MDKKEKQKSFEDVQIVFYLNIRDQEYLFRYQTNIQILKIPAKIWLHSILPQNDET